jgi:hypothetical protein
MPSYQKKNISRLLNRGLTFTSKQVLCPHDEIGITGKILHLWMMRYFSTFLWEIPEVTIEYLGSKFPSSRDF